jgi:hypothetical protein
MERFIARRLGLAVLTLVLCWLVVYVLLNPRMRYR